MYIYIMLIKFFLCSSRAHLSRGCKLDMQAASGYSAGGGFFPAQLNKGLEQSCGY